MSERSDTNGVEETAAAWESAPYEPILARPVQGPIDLEAMVADIRRRFPKTLARLAE